LTVAALTAAPAVAQQPPADHHAGHHTEHQSSQEASETQTDPHAHHEAMLHAAPAEPEVEAASIDVPDVELVTADGRRVHFYSDLVEGKRVAMNFVFTTCNTICPPMGANFKQLQKQLGERAGSDVELISVSVDPVTDTPERMRAWGERFGAGDGWTLVTGDRDAVTDLLKALGVFTHDIRDHAPVVLLGDDPSGTWTRTYGLAPPATLVELLDGLGGGEGKKSGDELGKEGGGAGHQHGHGDK
jgi:protein SCO1/2